MFTLASVIVGMALVKQDSIEVQLKNTSATYIMDFLNRNGGREIIPPGVRISLTRGSNSLTVSGAPIMFEDAKKVISLFDVGSQSVDLDVQMGSPFLKGTARSASTVFNANNFELSDRNSETLLKIVPRVNGDDSVTLLVFAQNLGVGSKAAIRLNEGETVHGRLSTKMIYDPKTSESIPELAFEYVLSDSPIENFLEAEKPFGYGRKVVRSKLNSSTFYGDEGFWKSSAHDERIVPPKEVDLRFIIRASQTKN